MLRCCLEDGDDFESLRGMPKSLKGSCVPSNLRKGLSKSTRGPVPARSAGSTEVAMLKLNVVR